MSSPRIVVRANRKCRRFHRDLDRAVCSGENISDALEKMFDECGVDGGAAISAYDDAVDQAQNAKDAASAACDAVMAALEGGGIVTPQDGGGK